MSDPTPTPTPRRKPGRGLRVALVLSLMVNVLVIGVMIGGAMRATRMEGFVPGQPDMRALWRALPREARDDLRAAVRQQGLPGDHGPRPSRQERRAAAAEISARMLASLRSEPFDAEAFAATLAGESDERARRLNAAHAAFARQVSQLTPDQRRAMADRFEESIQRDER